MSEESPEIGYTFEENTEEPIAKKPRTGTRRAFLGGAAGLGLAALLKRRQSNTSPEATPQPTPERHESLVPSEISAVVISRPTIMIDGIRRPLSESSVTAIMDHLAEALKDHPADIALTPEYAFYNDNDKSAPITLTRQGEEWLVDPATPDYQQNNIKQLQVLAKEHQTNIMAATFPEIADGVAYDSTLLHINQEGKIVGRKRKNTAQEIFAPEGDFTITKNGKKYKVLPVICGERAFPNKDGSPLTEKTIIQDWVKESVAKSGPFDILIHPQEQGDVNFVYLVQKAQGKADPKLNLTNLENVYADYYSAFFPYLSENGLVMSADEEMSVILRKDGKGIENYTATQDYASVKAAQ